MLDSALFSVISEVTISGSVQYHSQCSEFPPVEKMEEIFNFLVCPPSSPHEGLESRCVLPLQDLVSFSLINGHLIQKMFTGGQY
jgi:hypothetical protein